jgi:hypothetical protein
MQNPRQEVGGIPEKDINLFPGVFFQPLDHFPFLLKLQID